MERKGYRCRSRAGVAKTSHPLIFIKHPLTVRGFPGDNSSSLPSLQIVPFPDAGKIENFAGSSPRNCVSRKKRDGKRKPRELPHIWLDNFAKDGHIGTLLYIHELIRYDDMQLMRSDSATYCSPRRGDDKLEPGRNAGLIGHSTIDSSSLAM